MEVNEGCGEWLTVNTHRDLYRYNRLPFRAKSTSGIFQQVMETTLSRLSSAVDDVIIVGRTEEEHQRYLNDVLKKINACGFHIKNWKSAVLVNHRYLGSILNEDGRKPDSKIEAIVRMPTHRISRSTVLKDARLLW